MKRVMLIMAALLFSVVAVAQDYGSIAINVAVPQQPNLPEEARAALETKMLQVATQYGLASNGMTDRFVMTAKVNIVGKDVTNTTPAKVSQKVEVTMFVGDVVDNKAYESVVVTVSGVGQNEVQSMVQAINQIRLSDQRLKTFVENAERKIVDYYTNNCQIILTESGSLASQRKYDAAIAKLMAVPEVCTECYEKCMAKAVEVYNEMMETECQQIIHEARTKWMTHKDYDAAEAALALLSRIPPQAECHTEADGLMSEIDKQLRNLEAAAEERRREEWEFRMKQYNDRQARYKEMIAAARAIGVAYGENQPKTIIKYIVW